MKKIIITIDGHSACGKSTLAKNLAQELDYGFIDTGAMYRAVTYYFLENRVNIQKSTEMTKALKKINITFKSTVMGNRTFLNGQDVEDVIRKMFVSKNVSHVAAISLVRRTIVKQQQEMGNKKGIVMEGRDIGTVVFPKAELKIFLTADSEVRTQRRFNELKHKGQKVSLKTIKDNLLERDHIDSTRKDSPLKKAKEAITIDNTNLTQREQLVMALALSKERIKFLEKIALQKVEKAKPQPAKKTNTRTTAQPAKKTTRPQPRSNKPAPQRNSNSNKTITNNKEQRNNKPQPSKSSNTNTQNRNQKPTNQPAKKTANTNAPKRVQKTNSPKPQNKQQKPNNQPAKKTTTTNAPKRVQKTNTPKPQNKQQKTNTQPAKKNTNTNAPKRVQKTNPPKPQNKQQKPTNQPAKKTTNTNAPKRVQKTNSPKSQNKQQKPNNQPAKKTTTTNAPKRVQKTNTPKPQNKQQKPNNQPAKKTTKTNSPKSQPQKSKTQPAKKTNPNSKQGKQSPKKTIIKKEK